MNKKEIKNKVLKLERAIEKKKEEGRPVSNWLKGKYHAYLEVLNE